MRTAPVFLSILLCLALLCSCAAPAPVPTAEPTPTPSPEPTPTPTPEPTPEPTPVWDERWVSLESFFFAAESHACVPLDRGSLMEQLEASGLQKADLDGAVQRQAALYLLDLIFDLGPCSLPDELLPLTDLDQVDPLCTNALRHLYRLGCEESQMIWEDAPEGTFLFAPTENLHTDTMYSWLSHICTATPSTLTREQIMEYFRAVALHVEYNEFGEHAQVPLCRWNSPIYYSVSGNYTDEDLRLISLLTDRMNSVEGFPGIYPAAEGEYAPLTLSFLSREELDDRTAQLNETVDGYATYEWYNANCEIFHGDILYWDGLDEVHRPGVICEELVQLMGLCSDSELYEDSLFYQYYSCARWPSELDWTLFELLYSPALSSGMSADEVMNTLATLDF